MKQYIWPAINSICIGLGAIWINTSLYVNQVLTQEVRDLRIELDAYKNQKDTVIINFNPELKCTFPK